MSRKRSKKSQAPRGASARPERPSPPQEASPPPPPAAAPWFTTGWSARLVVPVLGLLVWAFGAAVRERWAEGLRANPEAQFKGSTTLTATDGYFWAAIVQNAQDGLADTNLRLLDAGDQALTALVSLWVKATGGAVLDGAFNLPTLAAPLLGVPLVAIGRRLGAPLWGAAAGAAAVVTAGYAWRTLPGYYDTDIFSVTAPLVVAWLFIEAVVRRRVEPVWLACLALAIAPWFYDRVAPVSAALTVGFAGYVLLLHRKEAWVAPSLAALALIQCGGPLPLRVAAAAAVFGAHHAGRLPGKTAWGLAGVAGLLMVGTGEGLDVIGRQLERYTRRGLAEAPAGEKLRQYRASGVIKESRVPGFETLAKRYAGSQWGFFAGIVGVAAASWRHRPLLLLLPLGALGAFALKGGLRFTMYAVPLLALGATFLAFELARLLLGRRGGPVGRFGAPVLALALCALLVAPSLKLVDSRPRNPVLPRAEALFYDALGDVAQPGDYAITWWDYGYPLYFFSRINAVIDGGKHGVDNLLVSQMMFSDSPRQARNLAVSMAELFHETGLRGRPASRALWKQARQAGSGPRSWITALGKPSFELPPKTRDVFVVMPQRLISIATSVELFSQDVRRPASEGESRKPISTWARRVRKNKQNPRRLDLGNGLWVDTKEGKLGGRGDRDIRAIHRIRTAKDGAVTVKSRTIHDEGLHLLYLVDRKSAWVVDQELFDSMLVQMLVLDRADTRFFEPVIRTAAGGAWKVRRP